MPYSLYGLRTLAEQEYLNQSININRVVQNDSIQKEESKEGKEGDIEENLVGKKR